ncbi:recombinase family protein [Nocardia sp. NPDC058705]|uniref:recombinase family protein n=1 Tax=Nocardia sp. NPDC058705 TaxID=3346609 RepID=UPI00368387C9
MPGPGEKLRVLGRLRLSRYTDESTSIERQIEIIQQWADAHEHQVIGWAEDIDVSRDVDPFDTPGLGPWFLEDKRDEWDIVATWKLDRLATGSIYLNNVLDWCTKNNKSLVSVTESFDLDHWIGRMIANVIAGLAEGELEAIKERTRGSRRKLRSEARWGGGRPAFGYVTVRRETGEGWGLEIDPLAYVLVRRIVEAMLDGGSYTQLARELNEEGIVTPTEYYRAQQLGIATLKRSELPEELRAPPVDPPNKKRKRQRQWPPSWSQTPIRNMIKSPALRGFVHHKKDVLRDGSGLPVQFGDPLVSLEEWERLQEIATRRRDERRATRTSKLSPLGGVVSHKSCGLTLHHTRKVTRGIEYRYYRCEKQDMHIVPADLVEETVSETVLSAVGDIPILERVWAPGDSKIAELREAISGIDALSVSLAKAKSATTRERIQSQIDALDNRIAELESAPAIEARWEYKPTGGTYGDEWEKSDWDARRDLLKRSGISVRVHFSNAEGRRSAASAAKLEYEIKFPSELKAKLGHPPNPDDSWQMISGDLYVPYVRRSVVPDEARVKDRV